MGFVIGGICNVLFEATNDLLLFIIKLTASFAIDVGTLDESGKVASLFDEVFPVAQKFMTVFTSTGMVIVLSIFIIRLATSYSDSLTPEAENPFTQVARLFISSFFVIYSYRVFIFFEGIANKLYGWFMDAYDYSGQLEKLGGKGKEVFKLKKIKLSSEDAEKVAKKAAEKKAEKNSPSNLTQQMQDTVNQNAYLKNSKTGKTYSGYNLIKDWNVESTGKHITLSLLAFVSFFVLLWNVVKLFLEMYERYVLLGVFFYTCPVFFSFLVSGSTRDIFKSWTRVILSQFLLMMLNVFFLAVFAGAFIKMITGGYGDGTYLFKTGNQFLQIMILLTAWLIIGQRIDQHLQAMGLSTAQTGGGLAREIFAGAGLAAGAIGGAFRAGGRIASATAGAAAGASTIAKGVKGGKAASMAGATFSEGYKAATGNKQAASSVNKKMQAANAYKANPGSATAKNAFKAGTTLKGASAEKAINDIGAKGQLDGLAKANGYDSSKIAGYEFGNGQISAIGADGNVVAQMCDPGSYSADGAIGTSTFGAGDNAVTMSYAANSRVIEHDGMEIAEALNSAGNIKGFDSGSAKYSPADGLVHFTANGGADQCIAAPSYASDFSNVKADVISTKVLNNGDTLNDMKVNVATGIDKNGPAPTIEKPSSDVRQTPLSRFTTK